MTGASNNQGKANSHWLARPFQEVAARLRGPRRNAGLEVGLIGVDGAGKTSIATRLLSLPMPVRVIYMGKKYGFQTRIVQFSKAKRLPRPLPRLALHYDLFIRRLSGWLLSRKGWIVVYDRHPLEGVAPTASSIRERIDNWVIRLYGWPVDLTFWLTGDYQQLYERKREYPPEALRSTDKRIREVLARYRVYFKQFDATKEDLDSIEQSIKKEILARVRTHARI